MATKKAERNAADEVITGEVRILDPITEKPEAMAAAGTVKTYVIASMSVGTLPLPLFDTAALFALHMRMVQQLAHRYGHRYSEHAARATILSLLGGGLSVGLGIGAASLLKAVPGIGWALGGLGLPTLAGATTYAIGQTYIKHFEEGGTLLDLDAETLRGFFNAQFRRGRAFATSTAAA
ncbi:Uncharacterized conserved protein, DUF697 family [Tistlia consotensis]|uniref:Uncharacterized conserved protein, DUF697 family n=1 Tax=Tistlia consotensis USBA 355 TaxID=560819 RepID=A0A1Y6B569_9PROT|nr:DUF697 domain-containing protein [Tistlia consotensis]SME90050.1 Uncharacterized conserved protein, DUF697 family [Tistlia consotensis USBA 355]SNR26512.1 Uncharacterized conserved protein, DUF697 family [Tistlia consotensis]